MEPEGGAESLIELLTLEMLDTDLFRARNPVRIPRPRLFGGQVAAQALAAAAATVDDDRFAHSLHGYFLRGGRPDRPTIITVDRDRDGRSFSARHVNARQDGKVIFSALASFQVEEGTRDVQEPVLAVDAGDPDTLPESAQEEQIHSLLDIRYLPEARSEAWRATRFWVRPRSTLPDDPTTRSCVLTYVSDLGWPFGWINDGTAPHVGGTSLDHAVWLHRPIDVTDWMFVDLTHVSIVGARGVFSGTIHARDGALGAYLTQEVLLRTA
jgi:acyl-CoA thioesterase-2